MKKYLLLAMLLCISVFSFGQNAFPQTIKIYNMPTSTDGNAQVVVRDDATKSLMVQPYLPGYLPFVLAINGNTIQDSFAYNTAYPLNRVNCVDSCTIILRSSIFYTGQVITFKSFNGSHGISFVATGGASIDNDSHYSTYGRNNFVTFFYDGANFNVIAHN